MNRQKTTSHSITGVFIFLLLGIFALFATVTVLFGAKAYRGTVERADWNNDLRVAAAYLRTMTLGHNTENGIRIEHIEGIENEDEDTGEITVTPVFLDALALTDEETETIVFVYDGALWEVWSAPEEAVFGDAETFEFPEPAGGAEDEGFADEAAPAPGTVSKSRMQQVVPAEEMEITQEGGLVRIRLKAGGAWTEITCAVCADAREEGKR